MTTRIRPSLAVALSFALLAGCQSTGGYQATTPAPEDEEGMSRTQRGALIGAAVGAVAGLLSGDDATERRQRALVGVGVGALAGGAIGRYQDNQERELRESLRDSGVDVVRQGDNITLDMPEAITFGFDSASLNRGAYGVLDRVADTLKEYDQTIVEVAGHTDSVGSDAYNQRLSERRAQAVADYLISRGVSGQRLMVVGAGEAHPVASNNTEAGRAENRRVEITIVPIRAN
ncbi:MAG TPA: cell envelope biogenesis protein OmpA [Arenimonas sp.]|nr:MAG: cell envelope biogenesis protein OmpA [Xanthomonadales bacterium GWF1_69_6]HBD19993.1 cell envelope biogenesis protein OmpA [Arenimonas sp.]